MDPVHGRVQDEFEDVRVAVNKVLLREVKGKACSFQDSQAFLLLEFVRMLNSFALGEGSCSFGD